MARFNIHKCKFQVGGYDALKYPAASKYQDTYNQDRLDNLVGAEDARGKLLDIYNSDGYKAKLANEIEQSKYSTAFKPSFNQLYNERKNWVSNIPIKHVRDIKSAYRQNMGEGKGEA